MSTLDTYCALLASLSLLLSSPVMVHSSCHVLISSTVPRVSLSFAPVLMSTTHSESGLFLFVLDIQRQLDSTGVPSSCRDVWGSMVSRKLILQIFKEFVVERGPQTCLCRPRSNPTVSCLHLDTHLSRFDRTRARNLFNCIQLTILSELSTKSLQHRCNQLQWIRVPHRGLHFRIHPIYARTHWETDLRLSSTKTPEPPMKLPRWERQTERGLTTQARSGRRRQTDNTQRGWVG